MYCRTRAGNRSYRASRSSYHEKATCFSRRIAAFGSKAMSTFSHAIFPHAMLREIYEQPQALERTLHLYLSDHSLKLEVAARLANWPNSAGEVLIAASGSSRHSGLYAEILLEDLCGLAVDVEYSSEYSCRGGPGYIDIRHPSVLV